MVLDHYFAYFLPFPWPINYNHASGSTKSSTYHCQVDFDQRFFPFLEFMALHMTTFHGLQAAKMNEELPQELSLNVTLTQHLCDENPELWEVRFCFKVEPPQD